MTVASALAGRRRELQAVAGVLSGETDAVAMLVVGAAGVGKSRLVAAGADVAAQTDVTVLTGWCLGLSDRLPFLPVVDVLRAVDELEDGRLLNTLLSSCPPFVRGEVVRLMPQLEEAGEPRRPAAPDDGWRLQRLFDALRRLLAELARSRPVAVVVEDVHWADSTTLEFLDYLLAPGHSPGVPLVLTCRSEEEPTPRLTDWLERLHRHASVRRLDLPAMTEVETAEQIELLIGHRAPRPLVHEIYGRSEGNAFFTEQLVAVARTAAEDPSDRRALPVGLTALLLSRTAQVGGLAREVMVVLAVAARPLPESALSRLCGRDEFDVRAALRELLAQRLLRHPDHAGRHQLRHALLAEAVGGELLPGDRRELHARVAALMVAWADDGLAAEIAAHFGEADLPIEELRWRVRAGQEAEAVFAPQEAVGQWRRAIALWDGVPDPVGVTGLDLAQVYLRGASSAENAGDEETAAALAEAAVARLAATASPATAVSLYATMGHFHGIRPLAASHDALAVAIEIGATIPPCPDYVRALHTFSRVRSDQGHPEDARPLLARAFQAAERAGFAAEQKSLLAELAWLAMADGNIEDGLAGFDRAAQIATEPEDPSVEASVALAHTDALFRLGELERVGELGARTIDWAERRGVSNSWQIQVVRWTMCEARIERGDLAGAARIIDPVTEEPPTRNSVFVYLVRADLDTRRGRLAEAAALWNNHGDVIAFEDRPELRHECASRRIEFDLWRGEPTALPVEAFSALERYCRTDAAPFAGEMFVLMLRACADVAERARATGAVASLKSARDLGARLSELRATAKVDPLADCRVPVTANANLLSWLAEASRLCGESDAAAWQRAVEAWDELGRPHRAAYARWRQAQAILAGGHTRTAAAALLRIAAAQAAEHVPLSRAIGDLARRARIELTEPDVSPHLVEPGPASTFGLTARERAVLQLLGQGRTNPEIGAALFISPRTASVHVTNILRKLDVATRVQAATVAERAGLLDG